MKHKLIQNIHIHIYVGELLIMCWTVEELERLLILKILLFKQDKRNKMLNL